MSSKQRQKLEEIQQKIEALHAEKTKIEDEFAKDILELLKQTNAFVTPVDVIIGGLLHVMQIAKQDSKMKEEWQKAGQKFRTKFKKSHTRQKDISEVE